MKLKKRLNKAAAKLLSLSKSGVRRVKSMYVTKVNGKNVYNYRSIALTSAIVAAAAGGAYYYYWHKKHGHVIKKKE